MQRVLPAAPKFPRAETPRRPTIPSRDRVAPLLPARRPSLSASRLATPLICRRILGTSLPAPQVALLACPLVAKKPRSASPSRVASQPASPLEAREPPSASPCRADSRRSIRASGPGLLGLTPFLVVGATRRSASPCQAGRRCPQVLLRALPSQELSLVAGMIRPSVPIRRTGSQLATRLVSLGLTRIPVLATLRRSASQRRAGTRPVTSLARPEPTPTLIPEMPRLSASPRRAGSQPVIRLAILDLTVIPAMGTELRSASRRGTGPQRIGPARPSLRRTLRLPTLCTTSPPASSPDPHRKGQGAKSRPVGGLRRASLGCQLGAPRDLPRAPAQKPGFLLNRPEPVPPLLREEYPPL